MPNLAEPEDRCICAPGTCPEWEAKAGLLVNDPDCDFPHDEHLEETGCDGSDCLAAAKAGWHDYPAECACGDCDDCSPGPGSRRAA